MNIRAPSAAQVRGIGTLAQEAGLFPAAMAAELLDNFLNVPESEDIWLVAVDGDDLIGLAYSVPEKLTAGTFNMLALATAATHRGQGIGRALVSRTEALLKERNARLLIVETSSQSTFDPTRGFYDKLGYREVARIPGFWNAGDDKVICLKQL